MAIAEGDRKVNESDYLFETIKIDGADKHLEPSGVKNPVMDIFYVVPEQEKPVKINLNTN